MAYFSSGKTNDEMVASLERNGILTTSQAINAFTLVDRGDFVNINNPTLIYRDAPLRYGKIHISAPHIYASALEQMELKDGLYFLNVGSGSGYFSSMVASILGKNGINHGIEIDETLVEHATMIFKKQQDKWDAMKKLNDELNEYENNTENNEDEETALKKEKLLQSLQAYRNLPELASTTYMCGDIFSMDYQKNMKYHRIYVGAEATESLINSLKLLLRCDGLMIVPHNGKICKIRKIEEKTYNTSTLSCVMFAPLINPQQTTRPPAAEENALSSQICYFPEISWSKNTRHLFPKQYQDVVNEIFRTCHDICASNVFGLPTVLWIHILSYASSNWFDRIETPEETIVKKTKLLMLDDEITKIVREREQQERHRFFDFISEAIYDRSREIYTDINNTNNENEIEENNNDNLNPPVAIEEEERPVSLQSRLAG